MSEEQYQDILTGHNYDGIQEYDNPTPSWWWWIFHGTVVYSIVYFVFFHLSVFGWTREQAYRADVKRNFDQQFAALGQLEPTNATITRFLDEPEWLDVGRSVFEAQCISCHGKRGEGLVGPNLTDHHYKNVKEIDDIAEIVINGAANGAMPAWRTRLSMNEIVLVSSYVASLRGQDLQGPRPAEGEIPPPWTMPQGTDEPQTPK